MSIRHTIREAVAADPDATSETIARNILTTINKHDLLALLIEEVDHARRAVTKNHERAANVARMNAFLQRMSTSTPTPTTWEKVAEFDAMNRERIKQLMIQSWSLGDGTKVQIGEATLDQIRQRLDMLRKQHAGLGKTIEDLQTVERELVRSGATCLNDLLNRAA